MVQENATELEPYDKTIGMDKDDIKIFDCENIEESYSNDTQIKRVENKLDFGDTMETEVDI